MSSEKRMSLEHQLMFPAEWGALVQRQGHSPAGVDGLRAAAIKVVQLAPLTSFHLSSLFLVIIWLFLLICEQVSKQEVLVYLLLCVSL